MKLSRSTPCPGDTYPVIASCTCEDGSAALEGEARRGGRRESKCEDGTFPTCPGESRLSKCSYVDHELLGACDDGSDATLDDDKSTEPCEDGSRPNKSVCVCQDGTQLRTRGNKIKNVFNKIKDFFG